MQTSGNLSEPIKGSVDSEGHLVTSDPSLLRLHLHCGGFEGGPLAIPQLANLCRLSKRLGVNLSRPVQAVDDENIINMWVETRLSPAGQSPGVAIAIVDWKEKAAPQRDELQRSRQKDFDTLNALGAVRTDGSLRILSFQLPNRLLIDENIIGRPLLEVFHIAPPSKQVAFIEAIAERQPIRHQNARFMSDDQPQYALRGQPLIDNGGLYSGYRFSIEQTNDNDVKPSGSSASNGNLISNSLFGSQLGPALRQPIGKIIANAETIGSQLEGPLRGDYAAYAKDIASAGRHLMDLVNDLSDLEAIDRDGFTVAKDDIDLVDLAHRAAGLLAVKAADHQIRIDLPKKENTMPATGEFRRVLQILVNLIGNAIRYSPDGSVIKLSVAEKGEQVTISVADQGDGIDSEDHEKVFAKFERLGRSGDGGSGLGLFISRRLANAMSGSLTIESDTRQGAIFSLSLPARQP